MSELSEGKLETVDLAGGRRRSFIISSERMHVMNLAYTHFDIA